MSHWNSLLLLAQAAPRGPKPGDWTFGWDRVALVALGGMVIVFIAWLVRRMLMLRQRRVTHSPWCLFKELCAAHHLSPRQRQLLKRLAQQHRLEQPATALLDATLWEPQRLGPAWARCLGEVDDLRKRLFATG